MPAKVGEKAPDFTGGGGFPEHACYIIYSEGIVRAKRVEPSTRDQPEPDAVLEDLDRAL